MYRMNFMLIVPILLSLIAAMLINYMADVLPHTFHLGRPACHKDNCPAVFSWKDYFLLRKCPSCGKRSRVRTILVYLVMILMAVYLWALPPGGMGFYLGLLAFAYLVLVAVIDLETHWILLPLNIAGVLIAGGAGLLMHGWQETLIGAAAGLGIVYIFYLFGKLFTKLRARKMKVDPKEIDEAFAFGDVLLAGILGLFLGWPLIWFGLLAGTLLSGIVSLIVIVVLFIQKKYRQQALMVFIPLGPAFIAGAILLVYFPNWIGSLFS